MPRRCLYFPPESIYYQDDIYEIIMGADAIILLTEWNVYRGLDLDKLKKLMKGNIFIDLRNVYEPEQMYAAGFEYIGVGRSKKN